MDAWIEEVKLWDESNPVASTEHARKYLKFVEGVRNSEDSDDLKHLVQVEFVENEAFDKKNTLVVTNMLDLVKEKLSKTDMEKSTEAWINFMEIKQEKDEQIKEFVARFEQAETKLKNVQIKIPNKALAIHLMSKSKLESQSKENVLTKVDLEDETKIYSTMMKSMRELKSKLTTEKATEKVDEKVENKTYYGDHRARSKSRSRYDQRSRSKSKPRHDFYRNRSRSKSQHQHYERKGRFSHTYSDRRKENEGGRRRHHEGSEGGRRHHDSYDKVTTVHFSKYSCRDYSDNLELVKILSVDEDDTIANEFIEVIYK